MTVGSVGLRVVDSVSVGCRGRNEDRLGHTATSAWVVDGATGLAADDVDRAQELQAYLELIEAGLASRLEQGGKELRVLLREVIEEAARRFTARFELGDRARYELPSAGLAMMRQSDDAIEYALLGDCRILAGAEGARGMEVRNLVGSERLQQLDAEVVERIKGLHRGGPVDFPSLRRAITPQLREHRSLMNTEGGYWVLGLDGRAADRAVLGRLELGEIDALLLVSDGLYRLVDVFGAFSDAELLLAARSSGLSDLARRVRKLESDDANCTAFPRLKVHDDASAVLLTRR